MTVWAGCRMETVYYDAEPAEDEMAQVRIDDAEIVVTYKMEGLVTRYAGSNDGTGHFRLRSIDPPGDATLHMFPGGKILEGYWTEEGYRGFWRIHLER